MTTESASTDLLESDDEIADRHFNRQALAEELWLEVGDLANELAPEFGGTEIVEVGERDPETKEIIGVARYTRKELPSGRVGPLAGLVRTTTVGSIALGRAYPGPGLLVRRHLAAPNSAQLISVAAELVDVAANLGPRGVGHGSVWLPVVARRALYLNLASHPIGDGRTGLWR